MKPILVSPLALDRLMLRVRLMRAAGLAPVVLFDLDDTLFSTARRHLRILQEYAGQSEVRARWLEDAWTLSQIEAPQVRYSIIDTARAAGVTRADLLEDLKEFWFARFFRNEYIAADDAVLGAAEYCRDILDNGGTLVYVTGRDEGMRAGTLQAMKRLEFPMPDAGRVRLILKPRFDMPDLEFKAAALKRCAEIGEVAGSFENEPAHVNLFHEAFPAALTVLLETKHSGKPIEPHPNVHRVPDFARS